jgi:tRNA(His) 5'-end guanylyltransferase
MSQDELGDRMKLYERLGSGARLLPLLPVLARVDGRAFHAFTRGLERPYDARLSRMMVETTVALVRETNAVLGYTQSDEITLCLYSASHATQLWFDGRQAKMTGQLAALASVHFYRLTQERLGPEYARRLPTFDARVWNVPTRAEAANCFLWREQDATKNSLQMAARAHYSHKALDGKDGRDLHELLFQKGVNWDAYPAFFKRGTFVQRRVLRTPFTAAELESLPPLHDARKNPGLVIERSRVVELEVPPFGRVVNREGVVFGGEEPRVAAAAAAAAAEKDAPAGRGCDTPGRRGWWAAAAHTNLSRRRARQTRTGPAITPPAATVKADSARSGWHAPAGGDDTVRWRHAPPAASAGCAAGRRAAVSPEEPS